MKPGVEFVPHVDWDVWKRPINAHCTHRPTQVITHKEKRWWVWGVKNVEKGSQTEIEKERKERLSFSGKRKERSTILRCDSGMNCNSLLILHLCPKGAHSMANMGPLHC